MIFRIPFLILFSFYFSFANEVYHLSDSVWTAPSYLENANFDELNSVNFNIAKQSEITGFSDKSFWLKRKVTNSSQNNLDLIIELRNSFPDYVSVFYKDFNGNLIKNELGSRQRKLGDFPHPIFQIEAPPKSTTELFFHIKTESLFHFPMRVSEQGSFFVHSYKKSLAYGVFIGIQVFALLIGLINFFVYKHRSFGWYSCMVLLGGLTPLYSNGYFTVIFPFHFGSIDNRLIIFISSLYIFFILKFTAQFFIGETAKKKSVLYWLCTLLFAFAFISQFNFLKYSHTLYVVQIILPISYFYALYFAIRSHIKYNSPYSLLFLISQSLLALGYSISILETLGIIHSNTFTLYVPELTTLCYSIFIGSAITLQLNLQKQQEHIQKEIIQEQHLENLKNQENELRQNLIQKKHFTHVISHNLRSPLSSILGLIDIIKNFGPKEEFITRLEPLAKNMDFQLTELNELLQAEEKDVPLESINLNDIINQALSSLGEKILINKVEISHNLGEGFSILGNAALAYSVFFNLIDNSIKYRHLDRPCKIKIIAATHREHTFLSFKDNGIGIDHAKHSRRLFKLYERLTDQGEGTGKGLYLCQIQMRQMDGKIDLDPHESIGCNFRLKFKTYK